MVLRLHVPQLLLVLLVLSLGRVLPKGEIVVQEIRRVKHITFSSVSRNVHAKFVWRRGVDNVFVVIAFVVYPSLVARVNARHTVIARMDIPFDITLGAYCRFFDRHFMLSGFCCCLPVRQIVTTVYSIISDDVSTHTSLPPFKQAAASEIWPIRHWRGESLTQP